MDRPDLRVESVRLRLGIENREAIQCVLQRWFVFAECKPDEVPTTIDAVIHLDSKSDTDQNASITTSPSTVVTVQFSSIPTWVNDAYVFAVAQGRISEASSLQNLEIDLEIDSNNEGNGTTSCAVGQTQAAVCSAVAVVNDPGTTLNVVLKANTNDHANSTNWFDLSAVLIGLR